MTYNQGNKEKADSNTSSSSSLVTNLDAQAKTYNTYSLALSAALTHHDTQAQMSVANKPEFVKEFKESQVTPLGIGKGSGIPAHIAKTLLCTTNRK
jgi:predicted ATP-grasp superfamily ATP-dependent carboligase